MALPDLAVQAATIPYNYSVLWTNQSTLETVTVELLNRSGVPLDLSSVTDYVVLNAKEYPKDSTLAFTKVGTINSEGNVEIAFTSTDIAYPGVWHAEFTVSTLVAPTVITQRIKCFVNTEEAVSVVNQTHTPVTISEVRMSAMDRGDEDNTLLDDEEWSDAQIAVSIIRAVEIWNESVPDSDFTYTQITFPFKTNWIEGIIGELLHIQALNLTRNRFPSQTGGLVIDDKIRADAYLQLSKEYRERYKVWCQNTKSALNMENCYGATYNPYFS